MQKMKEQFALLKPFFKHLKKYFFVLSIFTIIVVLNVTKTSLIDGMRYANTYHNQAMIKGDYRLDCSINISASDMLQLLESTITDIGGKLDNIRISYPNLSVVIKSSDGGYKYFDAYPLEELDDNQVLIFSNEAKDLLPCIVDYLTGDTYSISVITDDELAQREKLSFHEAYVSPDIFKKLCSSQGYSIDSYYGSLYFDTEENINVEKFLLQLSLKLNKLDVVLPSSIAIYENNEENIYQSRYDYNLSDNSLTNNDRNLLIASRYNAELTNEETRINTPLSYAYRWIEALWYLTICSLVLTDISVFNIRRKEFSLYSRFGMRFKNQIFLKVTEDFILFLIIVSCSALGICLVKVLLNFIAPLGDRLIYGEDLFFRDVYAIGGKYQLKYEWLHFLNETFNVFVVFMLVSLSINTVLIIKQKREESI